MKQFPPLDCSRIVYRAILNKRWVDSRTGSLSAAVFLRRGPHPETNKPRDVAGVSVNFSAQQAERYCPNSYGACTLHVGHVRSIPTDPALDVLQNAPDHANIVGLPAHGEDKLRADFLAGKLVEQARLLQE
jgi:hypothetical protein